MREHWPTIRLQAKDGAVVARDGIVVSFFIHRDHEEVAHAVWRALQAYVRAIPPGTLKWYATYDGDFDPLDEQGWEFNRKYLLERPTGKAWTVELSQSPSEVQGYLFEYHGRHLDDLFDQDPATTVSFTFPTEYLLDHGPSHLRTLVLELGHELPFHFGYASPALVSPRGYWSAGDWDIIESLLARYQALDLHHAHELARVIGTHSLGASWLTFLGPPLLGQLGGIEALKQALPFPGVTLLPLAGDRLLITLAQGPDPIDTEKSPIPPQYRALAKLLRPFMYEYKGTTDGIQLHMNRWLRRLCA